MKVLHSILLITLLFCLSCAKKEAKDGEKLLGLDYYPTTKGKYVIYDVDSTVFTDLPRDTIHYSYRIKERIADSFTNRPRE